MSWTISKEMKDAGVKALEDCNDADILHGDPEMTVMTIYNAMRRLEDVAPRLRRVERSALLARTGHITSVGGGDARR